MMVVSWLRHLATLPAAAMLIAAFTACHSTPSAAQALYAITQAQVEPTQPAGKLYIVDPDTAATTLVGPLRLRDGGAYVGATGLAVHPRNGLLYGITGGSTPGMRPSLITVDPMTAEATFIGRLQHPASDINFDAAGTLFIWLIDVNQLGTVDLASGVAKPLGPESSVPGGNGGGLAIDAHGIAHIATTTAVGTLDKFDTHTGTRRTGPVLSGAPYLSAIRSLTFSPAGILYGVNTDLAVPAKSALVTIDPASGVVSLVGALPDDANGLAFSPDIVATAAHRKPRRFTFVAIAVAAFGGVIALAVVLRRRRHKIQK
jgi:hypothetical protein